MHEKIFSDLKKQDAIMDIAMNEQDIKAKEKKIDAACKLQDALKEITPLAKPKAAINKAGNEKKPKAMAILPKFANAVQPLTAMHLFESSELHVGKNLGEGSFKSAFKCDWNGTPVVKMNFHLDNQDNAEANKNFREELSILAKMAHPNIVQFLGRCKNEPAFVISYCSNGSLFDLLFRPDKRSLRDKLSTQKKILIALQVARAVNFMHHSDPPMIHRDLKSSNILLTEHLDAMVTDFGLTLTKIKSAGITRHKGEGTVNYMSPETFIVNGPLISEMTDVWSYGCVLIELFGYTIPWRELNETEIGRRVTSQDAFVPPEVERITNERVKVLILKCLRRDPAKRISFDAIISEFEKM